MDDNEKQTPPLIECPSCHHPVPEHGMTMVFGRRLCLSCAGAWFDDDEDD
jgi:formylmethanofuran dehydrogenase subunit E